MQVNELGTVPYNIDTPILSLANDVTVRLLRPGEASIVAHHANNRTLWLNLRNRFPHPYTLDAAEFWINHTRSTDNHVASGPWPSKTGPKKPTNYAVCVKDVPVGAVGLDFGSDVYFRTAEIGYWLSEEYWGQGIMSSVVPAFVEWTWKTFDILIRLNAEVVESNMGSAKIIKKAGFEFEGRRPNMNVKEGVIQAVTLYGALRPGTAA